MLDDDTLAELVENFAHLDCGNITCNYSLRHALEYLPVHILTEHKNGFAIVSVPKYVAVRLAKSFYNNRDIIVLSEFLFPQKRGKETDEEFRFFVYTVLHEVAHAVQEHKSPTLDELTVEEHDAQENEARDLAIEWFNDRVQESDKHYQAPLTLQEVEDMIAKRRNE